MRDRLELAEIRFSDYSGAKYIKDSHGQNSLATFSALPALLC